MRLFLRIFVAVVILAMSDTSANSQGAVHLSDLIKEALRNNPELQAQRLNVEASGLRIPQAGAWADPKLTAGLMNLPVSDLDLGIEPMTSKQLSIMQKIPLNGITALKKQVQQKQTAILKQQTADLKNRIIRDVSIFYSEWFAVENEIELTENSLILLQNISEIALRKYEAGIGQQHDVLKTNLSESRIRDKIISLKSQRNRILIRLIELLGNRDYQIVGRPVDIHTDPVSDNVNELIQTATMNSPAIQEFRNAVDLRQTAVGLARKQYWPDVDVGASYSQRDNRRDFFSVQASVALPVWGDSKQDKNIEENLVLRNAAEYRLEQALSKLSADIRSIATLLNENEERIMLLQDVIILQAEQTFDSALVSFSAGKTDISSVLDSRNILFEYEIRFFRLKSEYQKEHARLNYLTGSSTYTTGGEYNEK